MGAPEAPATKRRQRLGTPPGPSGADGVVTFTVTDSVGEGPITYAATDPMDGVTIAQTAQVTFLGVPSAGNSTVNASPETVPADGVTASTVTVTVGGRSCPCSLFSQVTPSGTTVDDDPVEVGVAERARGRQVRADEQLPPAAGTGDDGGQRHGPVAPDGLGQRVVEVGHQSSGSR